MPNRPYVMLAAMAAKFYKEPFMNAKVQTLLNDQVNKEFFSAYFYLAIANYYQGKNLDGFGHWFEVQAKEEQEHAMKILKYLQDNGVKADLGAIDAPSVNFSGNREPLAATLSHEQYVTGLIHAIYKQAHAAEDFCTCQFMEWFIAEQGEEEKNTGALLAKYDLFGEDPKSLYLLNAELKSRV